MNGLLSFTTHKNEQIPPLDVETLEAILDDLWHIADPHPGYIIMSMGTANRIRKAQQVYAMSVLDRRFAGVRRRQARKQNRRRN